ncbi:MAG TPA: hypothetical protein VGX96_19640 [Candidatus Elarobacter sp.]|jgi:hypothetical protein|nr:hypothetical protein [Candidatus Elarobacter sp.]
MRRIVRSIAVLGALALSACSGGGSVLNFDNSSKADRVILTVQAPSNIARVLPGGALPISAVSVRGSQNGFVNSNRYKWSAALTDGLTYPAFELGQQKPCGFVLVTPTGGTAFHLVTDLNFPPYSTIAIDPTNEANILFIPPPIFPVPATIAAPPAGTGPGGVATPSYPYCVTVSATNLDSGAVGSITVAVVNPASPTQ